MSVDRQSRRQFLAALPLGATAFLIGAKPLRALTPRLGRTFEHPEPRSGIDASKVLTLDQLGNPAASPIYDMIREIPETADGIRCYCGCADIPGYYSLLTCYEEGGMAQWCEMCQDQVRLVYRRHMEGQTLGQIRSATDARFG
ncbi:MAG: hypothetical protein V3T24_12605 [Longimicrobiales bacterium]